MSEHNPTILLGLSTRGCTWNCFLSVPKACMIASCVAGQIAEISKAEREGRLQKPGKKAAEERPELAGPADEERDDDDEDDDDEEDEEEYDSEESGTEESGDEDDADDGKANESDKDK